jgi:outer membrane protein assembly factor BamB
MSDGGEIWRTTIGQTCYDNWPVFADGKLYVSGLRGNLVCFDAAAGKKEWTYSTGNGYLLASPTVWKDLVIMPSMDGTVTATRR